MTPRLCHFILMATALFTAGACGGQKDLTQTLAVQRSGVLGHWYQVTAESDLIKDKPSDTFEIVSPDYPQWPRNHRVGKVQAGTRVNAINLSHNSAP
jgi:hypothetical protein